MKTKSLHCFPRTEASCGGGGGKQQECATHAERKERRWCLDRLAAGTRCSAVSVAAQKKPRGNCTLTGLTPAALTLSTRSGDALYTASIGRSLSGGAGGPNPLRI